MGAPSWGPFCMVLNPTDPPPSGLAVFPANSAARYDPAGPLGTAAALDEATPWDERASLLVTERRAVPANEDAWPDSICSDAQFCEVCRIGVVPTTAVTELRLTRGELSELDALRLEEGFAALTGQDFPAIEPPELANRYEAFKAILSWRGDMIVTGV